MAKVSKISDFTIVDQTPGCSQSLMFARKGVVYIIDSNDIDFMDFFGVREYQHNPFGQDMGDSYYKECYINKLSECSPKNLLYIIENIDKQYIDDYTEGWLWDQERLRKVAQKQFLSSLMQKAWAKVKSGVQRTIQTALCSVWSEYKIEKSGKVSFVKIDTDEITTRRVGKLSDHGYVPKTSTPTKTPKGDIFKFVDLDKLALTGSVYTSIISFHAWQVW